MTTGTNILRCQLPATALLPLRKKHTINHLKGVSPGRPHCDGPCLKRVDRPRLLSRCTCSCPSPLFLWTDPILVFEGRGGNCNFGFIGCLPKVFPGRAFAISNVCCGVVLLRQLRRHGHATCRCIGCFGTPPCAVLYITYHAVRKILRAVWVFSSQSTTKLDEH